MHRLLQRQLKRYLGTLDPLPQEWQAFVEAVNEAYQQCDADRSRLERSLELSSEELLQANTQLQALLKTMEVQVEDRTRELAQANAELEQTLMELQKTQMQLVQTEKMSSIGQLVAGIAHEINNPINFIHGNLQYVRQYVHNLVTVLHLYRKSCPRPTQDVERVATELDLEFLLEDLPKLFTSMQTGSERIRQIVLSLRNFSRVDEAEIKSVDIHEGLESTLLLLQNRLKSGAEFEIQVLREYGEIPLVECYPGLLNQVFMHILTNAIDAIEAKLSPTVTNPPDINHSVQDRVGLGEAQYCLSAHCFGKITLRTSLVNANWVEVAIADTGIGIPPAIQSRIFDPFFTTKPVGKGTGMGMPISYQVITQKHDGKLECFSTPGQGSEFIIQIPIHQKSR